MNKTQISEQNDYSSVKLLLKSDEPNYYYSLEKEEGNLSIHFFDISKLLSKFFCCQLFIYEGQKKIVVF